MAAAILKLFHLKAGLIFNRLQPLFAENFPLRYRLAMYVTSSFIMIVQKVTRDLTPFTYMTQPFL